MEAGDIPRQRTGETKVTNERVIHRVGEIALEMKPNGEDSDLKKQLDEEFGPGGWESRQVMPETTEEQLIQNAGYYILEVYVNE